MTTQTGSTPASRRPALLRAELLKVTSTRMWIGLTIAAVLYVLVQVGGNFFAGTPAAARGGGPHAPSLHTVEGVRNVFAAAGTTYIFALVLGILGMTQESRFQTMTATLLAAPRRGRVLVAKLSGYALIGALMGIVGIIVGYLLSFVLLLFTDHATVGADALLAIAGGAVLGSALYAVLGVAVGALVSNQIAAVLGAVVWVVLVDPLLVLLLPKVGTWLPGGALHSVLQATPLTDSSYLPVWGGVLLLLGYTAVFAVLAAVTTVRRDVT